MASGINFNPASYQVGGGASVNRQQTPREQGAPIWCTDLQHTAFGIGLFLHIVVTGLRV